MRLTCEMDEDGDDDEMLQGDVTCDDDENFIRLVGGACVSGACEEVEGEGVCGCEEAEAFTSGAATSVEVKLSFSPTGAGQYQHLPHPQPLSL